MLQIIVDHRSQLFRPRFLVGAMSQQLCSGLWPRPSVNRSSAFFIVMAHSERESLAVLEDFTLCGPPFSDTKFAHSRHFAMLTAA